MNMNRNEKLKALTKKAYECANISNDDCTTYPIGDDGVVQVSTIENGKTFNFIQPANAKKRFERQIIDNLEKIKCYIVEHSCAGGNFELHIRSVGGTRVSVNGYSIRPKGEWYECNGKYLTRNFNYTENLEEAAYIILIDEDNI